MVRRRTTEAARQMVAIVQQRAVLADTSPAKRCAPASHDPPAVVPAPWWKARQEPLSPGSLPGMMQPQLAAAAAVALASSRAHHSPIVMATTGSLGWPQRSGGVRRMDAVRMSRSAARPFRRMPAMARALW